jgi:hypothetical protein
MKCLLRIWFVLFSVHLCYSQEDSLVVADAHYKEDQFYIGISYNLLGNKPKGIKQSGFSTGLHFGAIKDMPLNQNRNIALGIGLGYSLNTYNQNLLINKDATGRVVYAIISDTNFYTKNRFTTQSIELPIEFRWRTSTPTEYKFWRVYTGFTVGYQLFNSAKAKGDFGNLKIKNSADFSKFQYGLTLSAGYNTWNLYVYYGLDPVFSNKAKLLNNAVEMNAIKVGLMFYVL